MAGPGTDPDDKYEILTWSLFGEAIKELAASVAAMTS